MMEQQLVVMMNQETEMGQKWVDLQEEEEDLVLVEKVQMNNQDHREDLKLHQDLVFYSFPFFL